MGFALAPVKTATGSLTLDGIEDSDDACGATETLPEAAEAVAGGGNFFLASSSCCNKLDSALP